MKYEPEEIARLSFQQILHPDCLRDWQYRIERLLAGQDVDEFEAVFLSKDGRNIAVEGSCNAGFKDGQPVSIRGIFRDVTDRKQKEQELQRTQALLNSVIENLPIAVFLKDARELRFVLWSKAGEDLLGYSNAELIGKNDYDFFPIEGSALLHSAKTAKKGGSRIGESAQATG